ncbi:MAG: 4a-hydroxytetrahydrobiopterin dehydratase [Candidatus Omnitrophica bacterium]|nr:4a-hydroxytetrahydrobiopterin dehydratase [Candidatus Omnitrophota bacterium]
MDQTLTQKKCQPCEGIGKALSTNEAQELLAQTPQWKISPDNKMIVREFQMKNFLAAVKLINQVAEIAEKENHHPDVHLTGYRKLRIELSTHALQGLSENDFILAAKINELPAELKK